MKKSIPSIHDAAVPARWRMASRRKKSIATIPYDGSALQMAVALHACGYSCGYIVLCGFI